MQRRRLLLAMALVLGACSDRGDRVQPAPFTTPAGPTTTAPAPADGTLRAELTEVHDFPGPPDKGSVVLTMSAGQARICYEIRLRETDRATETHIHEGAGTAASLNPRLGMPGQTGGGPGDGRGGHAVAQGCEPAPASLIDRLLAEPWRFSVDVHTATAPAGAVAGRLSP